MDEGMLALGDFPEQMTPRQAAKMKTRQRLQTAARALAARGEEMSVARVAHEAGISTATAYRYYSDMPSLLSDAALSLKMDEGRSEFLAEYEAKIEGVSDPLERLLIAQRQIVRDTAEHECDYRLYYAKAQERHVRETAQGRAPARGGRRQMMIEAALRGLKARMAAPRYRDLVVALMLVMGPEPYLTLTDYAGISGRELEDTNDRVLRDVYAAHVGRGGA
jgi:AcrR family transcriptional regulator